MNKVTEFFMKRPTLFWSFLGGIIIAGILAYINMPKLEDPPVNVKQAMVIVVYPGATAHEVELDVAQPIEDALRSMPHVEKLKSDCQNGMCQTTLEFDITTEEKNLEQYFDLMRRKINDIKSSLPQGCYDPIVMDDMMDVYGIFYGLTGDGYDYNELEKYAKYIRRQLLTVDGVKRIQIGGTRREVINIEIPKDKVASNGIVPTQIMMCLQSAGKVINAGKYENDDDRLMIGVSDAVKNEEDIRNLKINTTDGGTITLGEIATVKREYAEPQTGGFFVSGKPAIAICLAMNDDAIVPDVGKAVDAKLAEISKDLPAGMQTHKIFFQPDKVTKAVNSFMVNLLESVIIVIIVLVFSMGWKSGLIIGFGLVLTIALSFPILLGAGTTLQRISLGAFIVAMGMLVDNAIVIMDGILVDKAKGLGPKTYLYRIGKQTALPLLGATIIAASTFICIYLSPGSAGEYAGDLFLVLCVSLLSSWFLALVQVPVCAKSWMSPRPEKGHEGSNTFNTPLHRFFRNIIEWLIAHKTVGVTGAIAVFLLGLLGMSKVRNLFFPDFDYNQFVVEYFLPEGTSPDRVKHDLIEMSEMLEKNEKIDRVSACMGSAPARYCLVRPMTNGGESYGELMVDCKDFKTINEVIPELRSQLRAKYPDAYIRMKKYNFSISTTHTVEVQFAGPDPAVLHQLADQAKDIMRKSPMIDPYSVQDNWKPMGKMMVADYIQQDALRSGIQRGDVGNALLAASDGMPIGVLNDQDKQVVINLQVRNADGSKITDLSDIPVWSTLNVNVNADDIRGMMTGAKSQDDIRGNMFKSAPLSNVIKGIDMKWNEPLVRRENGMRTIEAECDPSILDTDVTPNKAVESIKDEIEAIELPEGYTMKWMGEGEMQGKANKFLMKYMPITFFFILGVLLLLFNSWKQVLLIIMCFPFVICGIAPGLLSLNIPFTFMAIIGVMGLMGMMVKNSIVLMDEINRLRREEHQHPYHAIVNATVSRVRPVIMASLTTIVGMIPLVTDPMYGSMAVCIMTGLAMGTIITLILMPMFYSVMYKVKKPEE